MKRSRGRFELVVATEPITAIKDMFGKPAKVVSIKDINGAIAAAGARAR